MHSISICFGPQGTVWNLLFKTEERMKEAWSAIAAPEGTPSFIIGDDFGQSLAVVREQIHAFLAEDLDQSQLGQIERGLHNARTQARANQRAMGDPTIKTAAMSQGPAVLNGGVPRFS